MGESSLIFPAKEYRARVARLQARMSCDALLLTMPADIFYVTGFLTRFWESPARPWFVVLPASGDPIAVIPSIGATLMRRTWITDIRTWDAPFPRDDGISLLADTLSEVTEASATLGIPMGPETHLHMPLNTYQTLAARITPHRFVDATDTVQRVREIKSLAEVDKIRRICTIAGHAFDRASRVFKPGQGLGAVFRDFQALLLAEGADWVSYLAGAAGPDGYDDVIAPAAATPLAAGDVLMLDTGAVKDGYFCDFNRNFFVGDPAPEVMQVQRALWDATEDVISTLRPGMLAADAHRLLSDGLMQRGAAPCSGRLGHGLGLALTEWPSFTPHDTTLLKEGMVLTVEPSAFTQSGNFLVHEENIVLRADGAELLSPRAPRDGHRVPV